MSAGSRPLTFELLKHMGFIALFPLLITLAFFVWQLYPKLKNSEALEQQAYAELVAERAHDYLQTAAEEIAFVTPYLIESTEETINGRLDQFIQTNRYFDTAYLLDYFGTITHISKRDEEPAIMQGLYGGIDMSQSQIFRHSETLSRASWSEIFLSLVSGQISIAFRAPVGQHILVAEFAVDRLTTLSQKLSEQGHLVMILDQHAQLIAHPDTGLSQQKINLSNLPFFTNYATNEALSSEFSLYEQDYFGSIVQMSQPPWYVIVAQEQALFAAPLYKILNAWLISIIVILLTAMVLAYRRSRIISNRFKLVAKHARDLAKGNYTSDESISPILEFQDLSSNLNDMAKDIFQREQALQTREQQLRNTLEKAPNVAVQWYDRRGQVTYWNDASEHIFGYTAEEALGKRLDKLIFQPRPTAEFNMHLQKVTFDEAKSQEFELPFQSKGGKEGSIRGALFSIPSGDDEDIYVCMATDVSKQRQAEASIRLLNAELEQRVKERTLALSRSNKELESALTALQETMEQLVQSEKLAALGSLVAGVAHELNTPIGNALMAASSLEDFAKSIELAFKEGKMTRKSLVQFLEDARVATGISSRNLERASELITSFKQVAVDQSSSQRRKFNLSHLVQEILVTLHPQTKKRDISFNIEVQDQIEMDSYPGPLGQVISNLVINAMTHAYSEHQHAEVVIRAQLNGDELDLRVSDAGVGMSEETKSKIFDPFYTTRLGQGGSGLGLHIVHNLVTDLLGGRIEVDSTLGEGTCFTILVPRVAPSNGDESSQPLYEYAENMATKETGYETH